jgi:hypothetical protein
MKLLVLLFLLVLAVWLVSRGLRRLAGAAGSAMPRVWRLEERAEGNEVVVQAVCPGQEPLVIGRAWIGDEDFARALEDLREAGQERVMALNARLLPGR